MAFVSTLRCDRCGFETSKKPEASGFAGVLLTGTPDKHFFHEIGRERHLCPACYQAFEHHFMKVDDYQ